MAEYLDFELVWLDRRQALSMSKGAAAQVLAAVRAGRLPCNAALLRSRAKALLALEGRGVAQASGAVNARRLMNEHPEVLRHKSSHLQAFLQVMPQLLPHLDPTLLLLATLPELDRPLELVAVQYGELDLAFKSVLGTQLPGPLFSHLLRHGLTTGSQASGGSSSNTNDSGYASAAGCADNGNSNRISNAVTPAATNASNSNTYTMAAVQVEPVALVAQLHELRQVLGPELCYAALRTTPALVGVPAIELSQRLLALQRVLKVRYMLALLAAEEHGAALLLPAQQMEQRKLVLVQSLGRWARLDEARAQTLLRRTPSALAWDWEGPALSAHWSKAQYCVQRRRRWTAELAAGSVSLVSLVLRASPEALQRVAYLGDSGDMPSVGLRGTLSMDEVDFVRQCPGYRRWRLQRSDGVHAPKRSAVAGGAPGGRRHWGQRAAPWAGAVAAKPAGGGVAAAPTAQLPVRRSKLVRLDDM